MTDFTLFADYDGNFNDVRVRETVLQLTSLSETSRREGLLALEQHFDKLPNRYLLQLLQMVVDGTDPARVRNFGKTCAATLYGNYSNYLDLIALHLVRRVQAEQLDACVDAYAFPDNGVFIRKILDELRSGENRAASKDYQLFLKLATMEDESDRNLLFQILKQSCLRRQRQIADISRKGAQAIQCGDNPRVVLHRLLALTTEKVDVD